MKTSVNPERFADLFRKYRLKAGISTLSAFAELMRDEGYYYDTSLYTYWQNGKRLPNGREVVIAVISILASSDGIETIAEANEILASVGERDLQKEEEEKINSRLDKNYFDTLPDKINNFVGRDGYIKDIGWDLVQKQKVILHGSPGVGKTALSIEIGHLLKAKFKQGMYWIRVDIISLSDIINELLNFFGSSMPPTQDISVKLSELRAASIGKDCLLILDNVDYDKKFLQLWSALEQMNISILITSIKPPSINGQFKQYKLTSFNSDEFLLICDQILGRPFVLQNRDKIDTLGKVLGYLPIATAIILNQVAENPSVLDKYIDHSHDQGFEIRELKYDEKTLASSLDYVYSMLNKREQSVLTSCSIFAGPDFSIEAVAAINEISKSGARRILEKLVKHSLIEKSIRMRYRLHPVVGIYVHQHSQNYLKVELLARFYSQYLTNIGGDESIFYKYMRPEYDNIVHLITMLYKVKLYDDIIKIWPFVGRLIFSSGSWEDILNLEALLVESFKKTNNYFGLALFYLEDIGRVHFFHGNFSLLKRCIRRSNNIADKLDNDELRGLCEQKLSLVLLEVGDKKESERCVLKSLSLLKSPTYRNESLIFLAAIKKITSDYDGARKILRQVMQSKFLTSESLSMANFLLAAIFIKSGQNDKARVILIKKLYEERKNKRKLGIAMSLGGLANIAKKRKNQSYLSYFYHAKKLYSSLKMSKTQDILWKELTILDHL